MKLGSTQTPVLCNDSAMYSQLEKCTDDSNKEPALKLTGELWTLFGRSYVKNAMIQVIGKLGPFGNCRARVGLAIIGSGTAPVDKRTEISGRFRPA